MQDISKMLGVDLEQATAYAHQLVRKSAEAQERLGETIGRAETEDGRIKVAYTPEQGLHELEIDPRAMRMGSEDLASTIKDLVRQAILDRDSQREEFAKETLGIDHLPSSPPNAEDMKKSLGEVSEMLQSMTGDALSTLAKMRSRIESSGEPRKNQS